MQVKTVCSRHNLLTIGKFFLLLCLIEISSLATSISFGQLSERGKRGEALFQRKCAACHTIGGGPQVGPDLKNVTTLRNRDWLMRWILSPDKVLAEGDPIATELLEEFNNVQMPNLGLTESEAETLIAYLEEATAGEGASAQAAQTHGGTSNSLPGGNPVMGKDLFTGSIRFQNGGSPCIACHSIIGIGALGGGTLGPDLTPAAGKYGGEGLASILENFPFPTMRSIYGKNPLTQEEQAHLLSFLQAASLTERPTQAIGQLASLAGIGTVVLLGLMHFIWRDRLAEVRRSIVGKMK